jgi:hypothetical protein
MSYCWKCRFTKFKEGVCRLCGAHLKPESTPRTPCGKPSCGALNPISAKWCISCGTALPYSARADADKWQRSIYEQEASQLGRQTLTGQRTQVRPVHEEKQGRIGDCPICGRGNPTNNGYCDNCHKRLPKWALTAWNEEDEEGGEDAMGYVEGENDTIDILENKIERLEHDE